MADSLPFDKTTFFSGIEPRLQNMAKRFRKDDPAGEAASFFLNFTQIWDKIEADPKHGIRIDRETGAIEEDVEQFRLHLANYMVACFKYCLIGDRRRQTKALAGQEQPELVPTYDGTLVDAIDSCSVSLSDLIEMIGEDVEELTDTNSSYAQTTAVVVRCCLRTFEQMLDSAGDFPIVANQAAETNVGFFVDGLLKGLAAAVQKNLALSLESQTNILVLRRLLVLTDVKNNSGALRRKLDRYIADYKGGWKKRLMVRHARKK